MTMSVKSRIYIAEDKVRKKEYVFHGNWMDWISYQFPEPFVFSLSGSEDVQERRRAYHIIEAVYEANNIESEDRQALSVLGNIDYAGTRDEMIFFEPAMTRLLSDDEFAYVLSHEVAHNLCRHPAILEKLTGIHKELDVLFESKDDFFSASLRRMFEYEADIIGIALSKRAGFDFTVYRTETGKFEFLFQKDMGEYDILSDHPAVCDRIAVLDAVDFETFSFNLHAYDKRLHAVLEAKTVPEKVAVEAMFYEKLSSLFSFETDILRNRIEKIESLEDVRKLQYSRALLSLRKSYKNLNVGKETTAHRKQASNQFVRNLLLLNEADKRLRKSLPLRKKLKTATTNILGKMKKEMEGWQR